MSNDHPASPARLRQNCGFGGENCLELSLLQHGADHTITSRSLSSSFFRKKGKIVFIDLLIRLLLLIVGSTPAPAATNLPPVAPPCIACPIGP